MNTHENQDTITELGEVTESRLISLHKELKETILEFQRSQCRYEMLMTSAMCQEDILNNLDNADRRIDSMTWPNKDRFKRLEWAWYCRLQPILCRLTAIGIVAFGILIVLGEVTLFSDIPIGLLPLLYETDRGPIITQLLVLFPIAFLAGSAYYALFSLKLSGFYGLYDHNNTDPSNLAWSAYFLARMSAPLSYNFILLIKVKGTQFKNVMQLINIVPVMGTSFSIFFPLLLVVFCALNFSTCLGAC